MPALADLEAILERVFERTTARLFRARPQVVQVEHRIERAMERARTQQGAWTVVPNRYRVRLHPADLAMLADDAGGPEALAARLADATLAFARTHGYHLTGRPSVAVVADPAVERAEVEVDAVGDRGRPIPDAGSPDEPGHNVPDTPLVAPLPLEAIDAGSDVPADTGAVHAGATPVGAVSAPSPSSGTVEPGPPTTAEGQPATGSQATGSSIRREATETLVFRKPAPPEARAVLRVTAADGKERLVEVGGAPISIGRSTDNAIVLPDGRVSRHHGRLQTRRGTLVYTDLGSTNGSRVNGVRVDECALGMGDRIVVGDTVLLVEQLPV
jgi:FhaA, N-terminal domain/FHA domain